MTEVAVVERSRESFGYLCVHYFRHLSLGEGAPLDLSCPEAADRTRDGRVGSSGRWCRRGIDSPSVLDGRQR